jgi:uracil-DNA glycosylase
MPSTKQLGEGWFSQLEHCFEEPWWNQLHAQIKPRLNHMCPDATDLFRAFRETPYEDLKVILLAHETSSGDSSDGLAFSSSFKSPSYLTSVIFDDLAKEFGVKPQSPNLTPWANRGVLLLNIIMSTDAGIPGSHQNFGWIQFAREVMEAALKKENLIIMAWGKPVQRFAQIYEDRATVVKKHHPSINLISSGEIQFHGGFNEVNQLLTQSTQKPIQWIF